MVGHAAVQKIVAIGLIVSSGGVVAQALNPQENGKGIRVMFYNVENLFHPDDDSLKSDEEFTPEGLRYWSLNRYREKLADIAKVAIAIGGWEPPALIGLCEIENRRCLDDLVFNSPLKKFGYQVIHQESGDDRGIDVALLVRPEYFATLETRFHILKFPEENSRASRDILYAKGLVGDDTLHVFVNHWPSRFGGQMATESKRQFAASTLRAHFDSLLRKNPNALILAMGDYNDHPNDPSMYSVLRAKTDTLNLTAGDLLNPISRFEHQKGTHKYEGEWGILDQIILSQALGQTGQALYVSWMSVQIFDADFLLEADASGIGKIPNRTYVGYQYHGGFADHLPVYADILFRTEMK